MSSDEIEKLQDRIAWLKQKLQEMRRLGGPDYTPSRTLQDRTDGEIGGLKWVLREMGGAK